MKNYPRVVVAGVKGGSGKTTLSLAVISALTSLKALKVVPFKKGPDYIDAGWMSLAAGSPCYNLDPFLIPRDKLLTSFFRHFVGDIAVIEGNRGLYDGFDAEGSYSTGELAKLLRAPVILIVDCTKMTRTTAAVVLGCMNLDRDVAIKGVVLNQVAGSRHESVVRQAITKYCSLPVLGAFPKFRSGEFPERHMGLTPYQEHPDTSKAISFAANLAEKYLDVEEIAKIANDADPLHSETDSAARSTEAGIERPDKVVRIGVIRDSAFQFYYPENLEELERHGAVLVEINAVKEDRLPAIDALYIGGGFPETHALRLAENTRFRDSVRDAAEKGLPIYAECGGFMYLGDAIIVGNTRYPMVGIFPVSFEMKKKPQAHGYTIVEVGHENPFYPPGLTLHGHEFHYSAVVSLSERSGVFMAFKMKRGNGIMNEKDGMFYKNVFATYTHIHALGAEAWVTGMIRRAQKFKRNDA